MGVKIDAEKAASREKNVDISTPDSRVRVMVVETDEELVIAMDTVEIVSKQ
jgi:acetate kinase